MLTRGTQDGAKVRCSDPLSDIKLPLMTQNGFPSLAAESTHAPQGDFILLCLPLPCHTTDGPVADLIQL